MGIYPITNGKIVASWTLQDRLGLMDQLGLVKSLGRVNWAGGTEA